VVMRKLDDEAYAEVEPALVGRLLEARERLVAANIGEPIAGPCWPQGRFVGRA
jgi:hypothetical protein